MTAILKGIVTALNDVDADACLLQPSCASLDVSVSRVMASTTQSMIVALLSQTKKLNAPVTVRLRSSYARPSIAVEPPRRSPNLRWVKSANRQRRYYASANRGARRCRPVKLLRQPPPAATAGAANRRLPAG